VLKKEMRVIGIDDSPFDKFKKGKVLVIGTVFRGGSFLDGVLSTKVNIDGNNATKKIIEMINKCKFKPQLQCIFLDGIAVGGFNVIDVKELNKKTKLPVIVIIRRNPNIEKIKKTLIKIGKKNKIKLIEKAGSVVPVGDIYIQLTGLSIEKAKEILKIVCTRSLIPEPIRIAHLIASGITFGESRGKA
jgi:endonuclease V-like protein UPF0215 family